MKNEKLSKLNNFSIKRKITIISFTVILVLLASVGTTIAFLAMRTGAIKNIFEPVSIACEVNDDYSVTNTGTYSAYIRASVIVNYVSTTEDNVVYGIPPKKGTDYTISFNNTDWVLGSDGFYYHKSPVADKNTTAKLVNTFTSNTNAPDGYELKVQIIAEAIQSKPTSTVKDYWNVTVGENDNISK